MMRFRAGSRQATAPEQAKTLALIQSKAIHELRVLPSSARTGRQ